MQAVPPFSRHINSTPPNPQVNPVTHRRVSVPVITTFANSLVAQAGFDFIFDFLTVATVREARELFELGAELG